MKTKEEEGRLEMPSIGDEETLIWIKRHSTLEASSTLTSSIKYTGEENKATLGRKGFVSPYCSMLKSIIWGKTSQVIQIVI